MLDTPLALLEKRFLAKYLAVMADFEVIVIKIFDFSLAKVTMPGDLILDPL